MDLSKFIKAQLDLIVSTCDHDTEISNKQIKNMLTILATSVHAKLDWNNGRIAYFYAGSAGFQDIN